MTLKNVYAVIASPFSTIFLSNSRSLEQPGRIMETLEYASQKPSLSLCFLNNSSLLFFSERSTIRPFSTTTITDSTTSSVTDDKEKKGSRSRNARHVQKRSPKRQQKSAKVGVKLVKFSGFF